MIVGLSAAVGAPGRLRSGRERHGLQEAGQVLATQEASDTWRRALEGQADEQEAEFEEEWEELTGRRMRPAPLHVETARAPEKEQGAKSERRRSSAPSSSQMRSARPEAKLMGTAPAGADGFDGDDSDGDDDALLAEVRAPMHKSGPWSNLHRPRLAWAALGLAWS